MDLFRVTMSLFERGGADRIYVIDKGRIAQQGTHEKLMKDDEIYKDFVSARSEAIG